MIEAEQFFPDQFPYRQLVVGLYRMPFCIQGEGSMWPEKSLFDRAKSMDLADNCGLFGEVFKYMLVS